MMDNVTNQWKCGVGENSNVLATLKDHTLIISGKGDICDYTINAPWCDESITNIIIEDDITGIGSHAFRFCIGLRLVKIANTVTKIGSFAFHGCTGLQYVHLPESIIKIYEGAFYGCLSLNNVNIPRRTRELGRSIFVGCKALNTILIPESVRIIGDNILNLDGEYNYFERVISERIVPPKISVHTFRNCYDKTKLFVPLSSLDLYKAAPGWRLFRIILPFECSVCDSDSPAQIDHQMNNLKTRKEEIEKEKVDIENQLEELRFKKLLLGGLKENPKHVSEFMSLFNQKDGLKYLTHDIDGSDIFDYSEVLSLVRKVCTENFERKDIPSTLRELLNQFIFSENPKWKSFDKDYNVLEMTSGWSADFYKQGRNNLHPIRQPQFLEIIKNFKRLTRIESPDLETIVNKVFVDNNFEFEFQNLSKAYFYTHVGEFKAALETIFKEIQKRADNDEKKKVTVSYKRETCDEFFVRKIIITHHNSFPTRDDKDALIKEWLSIEKGCMAKIASHLQGYCHWSVETCIDGKPVRVNILREQGTEPQELIETENMVGFTHILSFYYQ